MDRNWFPKDYKIFRDSVHGDIIVDGPWLKLINSSEFQRLRRIRQLSVANLVFHSADHTRFSHSIGTFHVMGKIITQIDNQFKNLGIELDERDKKLALTAALLHDIGHGPFSHAFENLFSENQKKHEKWTTEIIKSKKTNINKTLIDQFDATFPEDVASLIEKSTIKKTNETNIIFYNVLSSLISSQIDADRLDYLVRDSYNTGVKFGNIDLDRIISAINITVHEDKYTVYIPEKYTPDIEEYLFSRFQMNKCVYYHPAKVEIEEILKYIFKRVTELSVNGKLEYKPIYIEKIKTNAISVTEYCELDEANIVNDFKLWSKSKDKILAYLCNAYLSREKFKRIKLLDGSQANIDKFKIDLNNTMKRITGNDIDYTSQYFWIEKDFSFNMYKVSKENIFVLNKLGKMQDITEVSLAFNNVKDKILNEHNEIFTYVSFDILRLYSSQITNENLPEIVSLISAYDSRNHIEIEAKYLIKDNDFDTFNDWFSKEFNKSYVPGNKKDHKDTYYDTFNRDYYLSGETIRIRECGGKYVFTIKTPVGDIKNDVISNANERFEFEKEISGNKIELCLEVIKDKSRLKIDIEHQLIDKLLVIENSRVKNTLSYKGAMLEISFDSFSYYNSQNVFVSSEKQIEIELKSEYNKKLVLNEFCKLFEKQFPAIEKTSESKLSIGMKKMKENNLTTSSSATTGRCPVAA